MGEALDLLRGFLKETGDNVILPSPALVGKGTTGGGGTGQAGATPAAPDPPTAVPSAAPALAPAPPVDHVPSIADIER